MTKRNSKTARIVAALALSAGFFSAANASTIINKYSCRSAQQVKPSCSTGGSVAIPKGGVIYFGAFTEKLNEPNGVTATLTINNGYGIIFKKRISSPYPYTAGIKVTGNNRKFSATIVADWTDPNFNLTYAEVSAKVSSTPLYW